MLIETHACGQCGHVATVSARGHANFRKGVVSRKFWSNGSNCINTKYLEKLTIVSIHDAREGEVAMATWPHLATSDRRTGNSEGISR